MKRSYAGTEGVLMLKGQNTILTAYSVHDKKGLDKGVIR